MYNSTGPIGILDPTKPIIIHGAGISGLLIGYFLKRRGFNPIIFEKENYVGGKIRTLQTDAGIYETAANAIFSNDDVYELLEELNISAIAAQQKLKKKIFRFGKITSFPIRVYEIFRILLCLFRKVPDQNLQFISVYDFFVPLCGRNFTQEVIGAGLAGIYATKPENLNFLSIFKVCPQKDSNYWQYFKMLKNARRSKTKATSLSFPSGMQAFINALKYELKDNIKIGKTAQLSPEQNHIICTDSRDAAQVLTKGFPELSQELNKISYQELSTSTLFLTSPIQKLEKSFGVVFSDNGTNPFAGVLNNKAIFPGRVLSPNLNSYTVITKGKKDIVQIKEEFINFFNISNNQQIKLGHTHWSRAIPIYNNSRVQAVLKLRTILLNSPGLILFGNYTGSLSIRELITSAKDFALKVSLEHSTSNQSNESTNSIS